MAYCLRSFVEILEHVLHPDQHRKNWILDHDKIPQVQSLWETASFLRDFLDNSSSLIQERIASLEDQIMDAAEKAEDTLETYLTSRLISSPEGQAFMISPPNLEEAIQAFEDAKKEVIKFKDACQRPDDNVSLSISSTRYHNSKNAVVGVTEDLNQLRSRLTSRASELDIVPIVGMGGMGKTTLARILYDDFSPTSKSHFDCCAWVTVSQTYDVQLVLRTLLAGVTRKPLKEISDERTNELLVTLYKTLFGRRYLIVLDDIWSCKAWDDVQRAFPRDRKGSRIILTTRENIVADYVNSKCHEMHLIDEDDSWALLRGKVFGEESCPRVLEEVGRSIARSCGGLPLALQVIGGLLSQSQKNIDIWEHVAYNVRSLIAKTDDQFSGIFSWSFAHLPHYLKPCFLYMAGFREDESIPVSKIIKLWVAEGFLYPIRDKSLEEAARIHLNSLVDRNLIFVHERKNNGKVKSYGVHDLLRDLCLRKAQEKFFLYFEALQTDNLQKDASALCRIVNVDAGEYPPILAPLIRSFRTYNSSDDTILSCLCFKLSLLRVLDLSGGFFFNEFPGEILHLVNLRYLHIWTCTPASFSGLRNLQTLITSDILSLAMISDMPQLRHLKFILMAEYSELLYGLHENLQSLSKIKDKELKKLLGKLPNLRKLKIECNGEFIDLTCFHNLESLTCWYGFIHCLSFSHNMIFPVSLKQLSLNSCEIGQSLLDAIGELPNLQILKIRNFGLTESMDWEPSEDGFCELIYLEIDNWNLVNWLATEVHFPVLKHLVLKTCSDLIEIPYEFGDIATLKIIEVDECLPSVIDSARRIYEEQCKFGNTLLQLRLGLGQVAEGLTKWLERELNKEDEEEAVHVQGALAVAEKVVHGPEEYMTTIANLATLSFNVGSVGENTRNRKKRKNIKKK